VYDDTLTKLFLLKRNPIEVNRKKNIRILDTNEIITMELLVITE